jgi:tetratricopeptide (TPR) repeat protein
MVPPGREVANRTELYADAAAPLGRAIPAGFRTRRPDDWDAATDHHELRLAILSELGDERVLADALVALGTLRARQGRMLDAVDGYARGLAQLRRIGDRAGEAETLTALGLAFAGQRRHAAATACWALSLTLLRELGDRSGQARVLRRLGALHARRRRWRHAAAAYARSLTFAARLRSGGRATGGLVGSRARAAG